MVATTRRHPSRTRRRTAPCHATDDCWRGHRLRHGAVRYARCRRSSCPAGRCHSPGPTHPARTCGFAVARSPPRPPARRVPRFGAPQSVFALERHLNHSRSAAASRRTSRRGASSSDPVDGAVGQVIRDPIDLAALLDRALALSATEPNARIQWFECRGHREARDRLRYLHARCRFHRFRRGAPRVNRDHRSLADGRVRVPAPRCAEIGQEPIPYFHNRRRRPASGRERHRHRAARTRPWFRTPAPPSPRARAWSSESWWRLAALSLRASWHEPLMHRSVRPQPAASTFEALVPAARVGAVQPPPGRPLGRPAVQGDAYRTTPRRSMWPKSR